jgi:hypothetical protein
LHAALALKHRMGVLRRRRPFLIRPLENTLVKLILSLEFYSQAGRQKIAISASRTARRLLGFVQPSVFPGRSAPLRAPFVAEKHTKVVRTEDNPCRCPACASGF